MWSHFSHVQLFVTLWTVAYQAPLFMGFSRQECWSGLPFPTPRDLSNPGIEPVSLMSPALAGGFFTTSAPWDALRTPYLLSSEELLMDKKEGTRKMSGSPPVLLSWEFRDIKWEMENISKIYILGIIWQSLYLVTHKSAWQPCLRIFQSGLNHVLTEWFQTVQRGVEILNVFTVYFPLA